MLITEVLGAKMVEAKVLGGENNRNKIVRSRSISKSFRSRNVIKSVRAKILGAKSLGAKVLGVKILGEN
jgi:hypothetical protein